LKQVPHNSSTLNIRERWEIATYTPSAKPLIAARKNFSDLPLSICYQGAVLKEKENPKKVSLYNQYPFTEATQDPSAAL
jgi:hypothetical protein